MSDPRRRRLAATLAVSMLAVVAGVAGCGGKAGYGRATEGTFMASCNPGHDRSLDAVCHCAYARLVERYTYDQFLDLDKRLASDPKKIPDEVLTLVTSCALDASSSRSSSSSR